MGIFPNFCGENSNNVWNHHLMFKIQNMSTNFEEQEEGKQVIQAKKVRSPSVMSLWCPCLVLSSSSCSRSVVPTQKT